MFAALAASACVDLSLPERAGDAGRLDDAGERADAGGFDAIAGDALELDAANDIPDAAADAGIADAFDAGTRDADTPRALLVEHLQVEQTSSATFVDIPGAVLEVIPSDPSEIWIVFATGRIASTSDAPVAAEARLMIGDAEADLFGHAAVGGNDAFAGFAVFDRITGSRLPQTVALEFRAAEGTTAIADVRIAAILIPNDADFQYFEQDAAFEIAALDLALETLPFRPIRDGEYFVFGKTSQSNLPGGGGVQTWIETSAGDVRPDAPTRTHFTNARAAAQPAFTAFRTTFTADAQQWIALLGSSGGNAAGPPWWDESYIYRRNVVVNAGAGAGAAVPARYSARLTFDHQSIAGTKSLASGEDVRLLYWNGLTWTELHRVLDEQSAWAATDTTLWFEIQQPIASSASDSGYWLYYGNRTPPPPRDDGLEVFPFYDDFSGASLDARWDQSGAVTMQGGSVTLAANTRISANAAYRALAPVLVEVSAILPPGTPDSIYFVALSETTGFPINGDFARLYSDGTSFKFEHGHTNEVGSGGVSLSTPTMEHRYQIYRTAGGAVAYYQDENLITSQIFGAPDPAEDMGVVLWNRAAVDGPTYNWVKMRVVISTAPSVVVGSETAHSGALPSRWTHRKLMAFRADAWPVSGYVESPALDVTTSALFASKTSLAMPAPSLQALVLQAERISSSSQMGKRAGVLRRDGQTVLETSHRIDAGGSRRFGYHHNAALATVISWPNATTFENGFRSPDGVEVECADSVIIVFGY